jgi:hypothetical protein
MTLPEVTGAGELDRVSAVSLAVEPQMLAVHGDAFLRIADLRLRRATDQDRACLVAETHLALCRVAFERTVEMPNGDGHGNVRSIARAREPIGLRESCPVKGRATGRGLKFPQHFAAALRPTRP